MHTELAEIPLDRGAKAGLRIKHILVPTDFSAGASKALRYGICLAQQFGASLTLLHVFPPEDCSCEGAGVESMHAAYKTAKSEHRWRLEGACKAFERADDLHVQPVLCEGTACEQITETARETHADLIVISTHGYSGLQHLIHLGSTAERVVRHAPCPVLVVRENERDFVVSPRLA